MRPPGGHLVDHLVIRLVGGMWTGVVIALVLRPVTATQQFNGHIMTHALRSGGPSDIH